MRTAGRGVRTVGRYGWCFDYVIGLSTEAAEERRMG